MEMLWAQSDINNSRWTQPTLGSNLACQDKDGVIVFSELFPEMEEKDHMPVLFPNWVFVWTLGIPKFDAKW
jgi:hypothetical protein